MLLAYIIIGLIVTISTITYGYMSSIGKVFVIKNSRIKVKSTGINKATNYVALFLSSILYGLLWIPILFIIFGVVFYDLYIEKLSRRIH
jgi:uncharacterized membrane protein YqhA